MTDNEPRPRTTRPPMVREEREYRSLRDHSHEALRIASEIESFTQGNIPLSIAWKFVLVGAVLYAGAEVARELRALRGGPW